MYPSSHTDRSRRTFLRRCTAVAAVAGLDGRSLIGQDLPSLGVASAGSIRAMLEGPLRSAVGKDLGLGLHVHAGGADGVARSLVDGSLAADVFIPVTAAPMRTVLQAGKAVSAFPIARTEMVILYSPKSRFAAEFAKAAEGKRAWWSVLEEPDLKFGRSNPMDDPSGRAILFVMMLAAKMYGRPDLCQRVLGAPMNAQQIQTGTNLRTALEDGSLDAVGSYRIATRQSSLPYVSLPANINLSDEQVQTRNPDLSLQVGEKTFHPEPLIFYATALKAARNADGAARFVDWLRKGQAADLFTSNGFAPPCAGGKECQAIQG